MTILERCPKIIDERQNMRDHKVTHVIIPFSAVFLHELSKQVASRHKQNAVNRYSGYLADEDYQQKLFI